MPKARISAQIICYNKNTYKYNAASGDWLVHMWGWWPYGNNPRWSWVRVSCDKVPDEVKRLVK